MIDKYQIQKNSSDEYVLVDAQGTEIYNWGTGGWEWPDEDAVIAMIDDAGIGNPQKSFFATAFLGPEISPEVHPNSQS